jgi:hypothetical protein
MQKLTTRAPQILSHLVFNEGNSTAAGGGVALGLTENEHVLWMEALCGKSSEGPEAVVNKVRRGSGGLMSIEHGVC